MRRDPAPRTGWREKLSSPTGRWSSHRRTGARRRSPMNFLWTTFTRFEPAADIHAAERRIVRNHIAYRGPIVIDARLKPTFPKELTCRSGNGELVTRRWKEYFPSGRVAMGDSERANLD
jgi:hypothetical protein